MKKALSEYFTERRIESHRQRNSQNDADQASFDKSFRDSLKYVEKNKESIAYDMACGWEEHKFRCKQAEMEQTQESRSQRSERFIEMGKSYRPAAARSPEKDEPNKSARQSPDSGGKMVKTGWGHLVEIHRNDFDIDRE